MPDKTPVPVPEHLQEIVSPPEEQAQNQSPEQTQDPNQQQTQDPSQSSVDVQKEMLQVMMGQSKLLENLETRITQMSETGTASRQYIADLEQRGSAAPQNQAVDFDGMTQQELAQHMNQARASDMKMIAQQFGELLQVVVPQWDGWTNRDAMYGLMARGYGLKEAYQMLKNPAQKTQPDGQGAQENKDNPNIDEAVEKRVQEIMTQQRSNKAGVTGKPAGTASTAPALTPRELHAQLWRRWTVEGEDIPTKYRGSPS